jgi:uracil-DNA glycosylase
MAKATGAEEDCRDHCIMPKIILIGEAKGADEERIASSWVGAAGAMLLRCLNDSGIIHFTSLAQEYISRWYRFRDSKAVQACWDLYPEVYRTNVFQLHPPGNQLEHFCGSKSQALDGYPPLTKSKYVRWEFADELNRLGDEILSIDPNVIVCLGNAALWAMAGQVGITKIRGTTLLSTHTVSGYKLLPTFHPASIFREWTNKPTLIADLIKAKRESAYPEIRRTEREIWIEPSLDDIRSFLADYIIGCKILSVDIETSGSRITCIGFAPSSAVAIVIPFDDERRTDRNYWPTKQIEVECWSIIRSILCDASIPKLFQNGLYDITFLWRSMGIRVRGAAHDTMLMQHALQPESLKGLGYLGSLYSDEVAWKQMRKKVTTIKRDN